MLEGSGVEGIDSVHVRRRPAAILIVTLAGWVNRHQLEVIQYLREENRIFKEHLGGRRLRLTDVQRRRLAVNGHRLGRQGLSAVATLVTPDTILRWHRQPIPRKWTRERRGRWDALGCGAKSATCRSGWRRRIPRGATAGSRAP